MVIERKGQMVDFMSLNIGDTFEYEGRVYMCIPNAFIDTRGQKEISANAVNFESGFLTWFPSDKQVRIVNAKLVIED